MHNSWAELYFSFYFYANVCWKSHHYMMVLWSTQELDPWISKESADFGRSTNSLLLCWITGVSGFYGTSSLKSILRHSVFFTVQLSYLYMTTGKTLDLTIPIFTSIVVSLLFTALSKFVVPFLPRHKHLFVSWLQLPSVVFLESMKIRPVTLFPSISHEVIGPDAVILVFWILSFKSAFSLSSFTFSKRSFNSSLLSSIRRISSTYLRWLIFLLAILIPVCASSSLAFCMMYPAYKLNK